MEQEQRNKIEKLASDVLRLSRNTLLVNLRFLDLALSQFHWIPVNKSSYLTDGMHLLYNPLHVLKTYKQEKEAPVRDYLHIVLHCVYRHMFMNLTINRPIWDLATDIAVENVITELGLKGTQSSREMEQNKYIQKLKKDINILTAEKIYRYLLDRDLSAAESADWRGAFYADDHTIWYMTITEIEEVFGVSTESGTTSGTGQGQGGDSEESADGGKGQLGDAVWSEKNRLEMAETWADISRHIQEDLETFSKSRGDTAGNMMQNLRAVNREKYDYSSFLRKFAVLGEVMKINDDEFDYIYYTYGLSLFKNMPLIEPLEYKEVKRIKEFVIAIDTSGSVAGDLVQKFIQKTYNILKSTESFFSKINLHIIQCDAEIQDHVKITTQEEFDAYLANMKIYGLGGTDFRPVFSQVDQLVQNNEFTNLKGLIYFTDGYGVYPSKKPDYETAFVFVENNYNDRDVPPWAIKLILQREDI